jgi:hypothetical protein
MVLLLSLLPPGCAACPPDNPDHRESVGEADRYHIRVLPRRDGAAIVKPEGARRHCARHPDTSGNSMVKSGPAILRSALIRLLGT